MFNCTSRFSRSPSLFFLRNYQNSRNLLQSYYSYATLPHAKVNRFVSNAEHQTFKASRSKVLKTDTWKTFLPSSSSSTTTPTSSSTSFLKLTTSHPRTSSLNPSDSKPKKLLYPEQLKLKKLKRKEEQQRHEHFLKKGGRKRRYFFDDSYLLYSFIQPRLTEQDYAHAMKVFMDSTPTHQVPVIWNLFLKYLANLGHFTKAFKLFNDMKRRGCLPNEHTFSALFKALANSATEDKLGWAQKLLDRLQTETCKQHGLLPKTTSSLSSSSSSSSSSFSSTKTTETANMMIMTTSSPSCASEFMTKGKRSRNPNVSAPLEFNAYMFNRILQVLFKANAHDLILPLLTTPIHTLPLNLNTTTKPLSLPSLSIPVDSATFTIVLNKVTKATPLKELEAYLELTFQYLKNPSHQRDIVVDVGLFDALLRVARFLPTLESKVFPFYLFQLSDPLPFFSSLPNLSSVFQSWFPYTLRHTITPFTPRTANWMLILAFSIDDQLFYASTTHPKHNIKATDELMRKDNENKSEQEHEQDKTKDLSSSSSSSFLLTEKVYAYLDEKVTLDDLAGSILESARKRSRTLVQEKMP